MKKRIEVKLEDYKGYVEKHNTTKLDKNNILSLHSGGKGKLIDRIFKINEEIFDGLETQYNILKTKDDILIKFKTKSGLEYRFDLLKEPNTNIFHLAFSLSKSSDDDYHELTDKKESLEVFNRLIWILKDVSLKLNIHEYCIGATDNESKNKIYEYMLRFISGWEKKSCDQYDLGWAIYFKL